MVDEGASYGLSDEKIRVVVRKRPRNKKEVAKNDIDILERRGTTSVVVKELKCKVDLTKYIEEHNFTFDYAYDDGSTNLHIYETCVQPLVHAAFFNGTKVTCFAYGQTGSGKTYTMMGPPNEEIGASEVPGLFLLAANEIFFLRNQHKSELQIWVSFYEIYCGKLYDLLNERKLLFPREDAKQNICIVGLQENEVGSVPELMEIIAFGLGVRTTGITGANIDSSRSHAILQISFKEQDKIYSKISFIDLAGSERAADTLDHNRQTRMDGAEINKSLLALKECIRALDQEKRHTPFRGSKLTLVLKDSFMGNCKTLMIANISPVASCCEHTLNTLRYADRVKELGGKSGEPAMPAHHMKEKDAISHYDMLSQALMLPRQTSNVTRIAVKQTKAQNIQIPKTTPGTVASGNVNRPFIMSTQSSLKAPQPAIYTSGGKNGSGGNMVNLGNMNMGAGRGNYNNNNGQRSFQGGNAYYSGDEGYDQGNSHGIQALQESMPMGAPMVGRGVDTNIKESSDLQQLSLNHEKLIDVILEEEDELIESHKQHIDDMMDLVKQEMVLLQEVSKPGSDLEEYVSSLDAILAHKLEIITVLRSRLFGFFSHLKQEEDMSKKFYEKQTKYQGNSAETEQALMMMNNAENLDYENIDEHSN